MAEYIQAWQCIGCGRLEAPQPCIGVCQDRKVLLIGKGEHEAALAEIARLRTQLAEASAILLRFEKAKPRDGQWQQAWLALQEQAGEVRRLLAPQAPQPGPEPPRG
ncbi:MAG: hypothetical protein J0H15_06855 [Xanthomonadales bacterium]|nr:hypothetical protein [Xanthomonadales bacterium]